jgi:hypothetical protein
MKITHKPLFRSKRTYLGDPIKLEMIQALQAVIDSFGDSESLLALQCRAALQKGKKSK